MRLLLVITSFVISLSSVSQSFHLSGNVTDTLETPVPFVNIGLIGHNIGTISDINGKYQLSIPDSLGQIQVIFSHVSYDNAPIYLQLPIDTVINITLTSSPEILSEVTIDARKSKLKSQGNKFRNPILYGNVTPPTSLDVIEFAKRVDVNTPILLSKAAIFLKEVKLDSANIRLNFYKIEGEAPGTRALRQEILVTKKTEKGWFEIDLEQFGIEMDESFFYSFEFIPTEGNFNNQSIFYGAKLGGQVFTRNTSLGDWKNIKGVTLTAYLDYWK